MKKIILLATVLLVFAIFGCKKDKSLDAGTCSVSDEKVETIGSSANISGSFVSTGTVENMIIVYGTAENLESAISASCTLEGQRFSVDINDLSSNTKYFYCFEFSNKYSSVKTGVKSFQTLAAAAPTVVTGSVSDITQTSAVCGGEVMSDGGATVTARGFCWSTTENPTIENSHVEVEGTIGYFESTLTNLEAGTTYYIRAYAKNSAGMSLGEVKQFRTNEIIMKPTVTTVEIKSITALSAMAVGNVSSDGGATITSRGFCWSLTANPTIENTHNEVVGTTGVFEGSMTNLESNKTYFVRAFATNSVGTSYGEELTFTTTEGLPVVVTSSVTEITATSAKCGGNVTDQGASNVTERGICWSTNHNPTIADSHVTNGSGIGIYLCQMTGLTPNATYYVRAYAKNAQGVSYGTEVNFVALEGLPTVTTSAVTNITSTNATGGGNVTNQGASNVTERGICWGTEHNPVMGGSHSSSGSGAGQFTTQMTGLTPGTKYYVRAYAKNTQGVTYGAEVEFTTTAALPTVTTASISGITQTTATGGGNVTADGGASVTERGICWSTSANPTIGGSHVSSGSGTGSFTAGMTGLTAGTTYHVRAYATNSAGTSYGNDVTFTTTATLPTVTTAQVSNITQTTAVGGGNVTSDGGANVTERGVCWSLNANPTTSDSHATSGTGTGGFTANMTGLTANTTYHVRAYAKNSQGTSYGSDVTFTTSQSISAPTVTTSTVTTITQTTAVGGGNVTGDGGATVTERGICWGTSQNPTTNGTHSSSGSGTGSFTVQMSGLTANTTYYVRAYAVNSAGTSYGEQKSFTTQSAGGDTHAYVDLGLPSGTLWATCNVGASNPEDYGDYYAWGETSPKSNYDWSTYQWCNGSYNTLTKYCTQSGYGYNGFVDNKTVLEPADDAAHVNWGGDWRMPTYDEIVELKDNCTWTWTTQDGKNGYRVTGSNNNSIFLPAAGYYGGSSLNYAGIFGIYWSSSLFASNPSGAYSLVFDSGSGSVYGNDRHRGQSVRPVCQLQK